MGAPKKDVIDPSIVAFGFFASAAASRAVALRLRLDMTSWRRVDGVVGGSLRRKTRWQFWGHWRILKGKKDA